VCEFLAHFPDTGGNFLRGFFSVMAEKIVSTAREIVVGFADQAAWWRARECRRRKERCAGLLVFEIFDDRGRS